MTWTYGINAVTSALEESPATVLEVWIVESRKPGPARERIRDLCGASRVRFRMVTDDALRRTVGDVLHQGVAARVSEYEYADADAMLEEPGEGLIVVLDQLQDPHNLGAIMRTAAAFGARGLVIPKQRSVSVTPAVRKVAAGAAERVRVARVTNVSRFLESSRASGWWVYGTSAHEGDEPAGVSMADRAILVMGSEGSGVRPGVTERCDVLLRLSQVSGESLNVSVAAGVLMYEWGRQRRVAGGSRSGRRVEQTP